MRRLFPVACLALSLAACGGQEEPAAPPPPEVGVVTVQAADVPLEKDLVGRLSPVRSADVRARVGGVLQRRVYQEGSDVQAGQVLFEIDPAPLRATLGQAEGQRAQAQANHTNAKVAADRARKLAPQQFIAGSDLDDALANERSAAAALEAANAAVDAARINLGYATVRAPIDGRAGIQQVTEGALVGEGSSTLLTTIDQIDPLYVNFSLSVAEMEELRAAGVTRDQRASVRVELRDGSTYDQPGEIDFSGDVVDPATGAVSLRATLPNPDRRLLPGTYVTLKANLGTRRGVFRIPQTAVLRDANGAYVYVVGEGDKVARKNVTTAQAMGSEWVIDKGLAAGDRVVASGVQKVKADAPAKPVPWTPQQAAAQGQGGAAQGAQGQGAQGQGAQGAGGAQPQGAAPAGAAKAPDAGAAKAPDAGAAPAQGDAPARGGDASGDRD